MLINGCQEGKGTPRLAADELCDCGYVLPAGSYETDYVNSKETVSKTGRAVK